MIDAATARAATFHDDRSGDARHAPSGRVRGRPASALSLIVLATLQLAAGCAEPASAIPFPDDAVEIAPGAPFARWWAMTESCAGQAGSMSDVRFFVVPR